MFDFEPRAVRLGGDEGRDFRVFAARGGLAMGLVHFFEKGLEKQKPWSKTRTVINKHGSTKQQSWSNMKTPNTKTPTYLRTAPRAQFDLFVQHAEDPAFAGDDGQDVLVVREFDFPDQVGHAFLEVDVGLRFERVGVELLLQTFVGVIDAKLRGEGGGEKSA